jgi:mannitol 2-dehydrogenase
MGDIFGDLAANAAYVNAFSSALSSLWSKGVRATLADYLSAKA